MTKHEIVRLTIAPDGPAGIKADRRLARFIKTLLRSFGWRVVRIETHTENDRA